jgi:hypothetical protein
MKQLRFLALFLVLTAFAFPAKDVKLQYKFNVGDVFVWEHTTHRTIKQSIPGMGDVNVDVNETATLEVKVAELTPTGAKLEAFYSKMKSSTKSTMGSADLDSEGPQDSAPNKVMKAMMNKKFFIKLSKTGVVEAVEGTENLFSDFGSLGLDEATLNAMKQQFEQTLGNESQKAAFALVLITYPDNKVKAGDTWKVNSTSNAMNFSTKIENTLTLKSFDAAKGVVGLDGTIATADKEKIISLPNGIKSKLDVTGKQASTANVNMKTGWSTDLKSVQEFKGTMILLAGGMIPSDMEVPIEFVTESEYKFTKK